MNSKRNISIIGGAGHVGFPLGLMLSSKGYKVSLIDKHVENMNKINNGEVPFLEEKSAKLLNKIYVSKNKKTNLNYIKGIIRSF